ncbi:TnpV protein [uncultured Ruminococcus sp.]|uniref:TnpV protein n=1 Tax=uncultured Ruminococcus sp. TaxID=165186 RepID=UPI0025FD0D3D|nr:TnpV protein [uncultured Ruminococcus sp.]
MKTELKIIGSWGRLHYDFLYRNNRTDINVMRLNGTLNNYLADMVRNACEMFDSLVRQTAENEGVTEQYKSTNQIEWIRRMNNIQSRVRELILNELIYQ